MEIVRLTEMLHHANKQYKTVSMRLTTSMTTDQTSEQKLIAKKDEEITILTEMLLNARNANKAANK